MRSFWLPARILLLALAYVLAACGTGGTAAAPPTPGPIASDTAVAAPTQPPAPTAAAAPSATPLPTSASTGATSQASAANLLVSYHKTGGIAGVDQTTNVYADGTIELRDKRGVASAKADPSDIQALQKLLESPEFAALQVPLQPPAPDQFVYELSVAGRAKPIVVAEGANTPQVLRDVISAVEQLARQAR